MRAITINEIQNFKRGGNPHKQLEIGEENVDYLIKRATKIFGEIGLTLIKRTVNLTAGFDYKKILFFTFLEYSAYDNITYYHETNKWRWKTTSGNTITFIFDGLDAFILGFVKERYGDLKQIDKYIDKYNTELENHIKRIETVKQHLNKMKEILDES